MSVHQLIDPIFGLQVVTRWVPPAAAGTPGNIVVQVSGGADVIVYTDAADSSPQLSIDGVGRWWLIAAPVGGIVRYYSDRRGAAGTWTLAS